MRVDSYPPTYIADGRNAFSQNMGQNCIGIERILVHHSLYDDLFDYFEERVSRMRLGSVMAMTPEGYINTVDGGAMINADRFRGLEKVLHDAEEAGAQIVGGKEYSHVYLENGYYFSPTIVGNVDETMEIAQQEGVYFYAYPLGVIFTSNLVFAPIALLMPYDKIEDAVRIANSTKYALGASVWGPDQNLCLKVAKNLECGMVSLNDFGVFYVSSFEAHLLPQVTFLIPLSLRLTRTCRLVVPRAVDTDASVALKACVPSRTPSL